MFLLALSVGIYILVYDRFALSSLRADDWRVWVGALIAYDFFYYWNHRIDHEVGLFWAAHVVHHQSDRFNLSTALRQSSSGALLGWIFYLPMAVAGVPPVVFVGVGLIDLLYQFWIHTELVGKARLVRLRVRLALEPPRPSRDQRTLSRQELRRHPHPLGPAVRHVRGGGRKAGVRRARGPRHVRPGCGRNLAYYATMADLCRRARDRRDKIKVWFAPPGWVPANLRPAGPTPPFDLAAVEDYDPPARPTATAVAFAALVVMVGATAAFLVSGPGLPSANGLIVFLAIAASLWAIGALLDGRISVLEERSTCSQPR